MDLEDLFEGKRPHGRGHHGDHGYGHGRRDGHHGEHEPHGHDRRDHAPYGHGHERYDEHDRPAPWTTHDGDRSRRHGSGHAELQRVLELLSAHKGLVLVVGALLILLFGALLYFLLPLLGQALGWIDQNGVKGTVERLWQGSGGR